MREIESDRLLELSSRWQDRDNTLDLVEHWRSIAKRKWSVIGLALAITLLATVMVYLIEPVYRSTATLLIEQDKSKIVSIEEVYSGVSANREYFQTQAEILKSRELARKVIAKLDLGAQPEFDSRETQQAFWKKWLAAVGYAEPRPTPDAIEKGVMARFSQRLTVEPIRLSQLIKISFDLHDAALAAKVANAMAETYIESDLDARYQMTQKAGEWLNSRLAGLKEKLAQSEKALQDYRDQQHIVDTKGMALGGYSRQLEDVTKSLVDARMRRAETESAYNQVKVVRASGGANYDSIPAVVRDPLVAKLREAEAEAQKKVSELSNRYGHEHPKMAQAEAELRAAKESTRRQIENVVAGLTKEYEAARANEQALAGALGETKSQIQGLNRKEFQLGVLEREVDSNRQLYNMFVSRFKETSATNNMQTTSARIIDPAVPTQTPLKPKKDLVIAAALVLGLFFSTLLALLLDRLDNTIKSTEDAETRLGLPVLTTVPRIADKSVPSQRMYLDQPKSVFAETIRTARTGVLLSAIDQPHKVLIVTSSVPGEGKTTVAMNLAFAHAQTKKVLLIDADMRRPTIGKSLGIEQTAPGLSNLISGTVSVQQCIYPVSGSEAVVMPSGNIPPNPLELLLSHRFKELIVKLKERFDIIVIDAPPVHLVSDALVAAGEATGVIYVVKADDTAYQVARQGVRRLKHANAPIIGAVLNQLDFKKADKYYGEHSGYEKYGYESYYGVQEKV